MPQTLEEVEEKMTMVDPFVEWVQIDVMDGDFVPGFAWPYTDKKFTREELVALRYILTSHPSLAVEIDLMISNPKEEAEMWILAGARRLIFHHESLKGDIEFLKNLKNEYPMIQYAIALLPYHDVSVLEKYIPYINQVQCMGINEIGKQAQPFAPEVCSLIESIKHAHPTLSVSVDGGVNAETAQRLKDSGANILVSGSFVYTASDVQSAIHNLRDGMIY